MKALLTVVAVAVMIAVTQGQGNSGVLPVRHIDTKTITHAKVAQEVYDTCNKSRTQINGATEANCGTMQDKNSSEFLCQQRNALPSNQCWVEVK